MLFISSFQNKISKRLIIDHETDPLNTLIDSLDTPFYLLSGEGDEGLVVDGSFKYPT